MSVFPAVTVALGGKRVYCPQVWGTEDAMLFSVLISDAFQLPNLGFIILPWLPLPPMQLPNTARKLLTTSTPTFM